MRAMPLVFTLGLLLAGLGGAPPIRAQAPPRNILITDTGLGETRDAYNPAIATFGDAIYAVWSDEREDDWPRVYFARSLDGGRTWSANLRLNRLPSDSFLVDPAIAVQPDGTIWVVWHHYNASIDYPDASDNDIWLARSTDGGQTFTSDILVNGTDGREDLHGALLKADPDGGLLYVLLHVDRTEGPFVDWGADLYLVAVDTQTLESRLTQVNDSARSGRRQEGLQILFGPKMSLAVGDGLVCAAWEDRRERFAVFGACSTDQGQTFAASRAISGPDAKNPRIAIGPGGLLYGAYSDRESPLVLRRSADRGATWAAPAAMGGLDVATSVSAYDLTLDPAGRLALAWVEEPPALSLDGSNLFLSTSADQGATFRTRAIEDGLGEYPETAFQDNPALVLASVGDRPWAYLAWNDDRNTWDKVWFSQVDVSAGPEPQIYLPMLSR